MLKRATILLITALFIIFPLTSISAASVPEDIRKSINEELQNQKQEINIFLNQDQPQQNINATNDISTENHLGDGYPLYTIKNASQVKEDNQATNSLTFSGYLFLIEDDQGHSKALAFADKAPNYNEITQVSSEAEFSDANFSDPLEKAKNLIGYNKDSKLIYDSAHQVIALVTSKDNIEQVALVKNSTLNHMKQFEVLPFSDFISQIRQTEMDQAKLVSQSNEPVSGSGGSATGNGGAGNLQNVTNTSTLSPYIWGVSAIVLIGIGVLSYVMYRKRKQRSLSHQ